MPRIPTASRAITPTLAMLPVTNSQLKTALKRTTTPNRPPMRPQFFRFIGSAPPVRLDRAVGREQAEDDDREEVDHVLQLERALAEGIEVRHGSQIGDGVADPALR